MFAPTVSLFKKGGQLLCPAGHFLYERRQFCNASSTEEVASRRLDGGVSGEQCSPLRFLFSKRVDNSSALPGISSGEGDFGNVSRETLRRWCGSEQLRVMFDAVLLRDLTDDTAGAACCQGVRRDVSGNHAACADDTSSVRTPLAGFDAL